MRIGGLWMLSFFPLVCLAGTEDGVFSVVEGDEVFWDSQKQNQRSYPQAGEIFESKDRLQTGNRSRSEMLFAENVVVRVGPNTQFTLQRRERLFSVEAGDLLLQKEPAADSWTLQTGGLSAAISGSTVLFSRPSPQQEFLYLLETSSSNGVEVRFPLGTPQLSSPLRTGQLLISENGRSREVIPFDPAILWNSSPLGQTFPGTVWSSCIDKIPSRSPPRSTLAWTTNWNSCEGYPATLARRVQTLLPADRKILRGAYGTVEEAKVLVEEGSVSTITDPEGHHSLSAALDTGRMDLVRILLPAFNPGPYQAKGREEFPSHFLYRSPWPKAVLMLSEKNFSEFLTLGSANRREVWDVAAVVGNYLLRKEEGPQGFYDISIPRNWVSLVKQSRGISKEEKRELISSCLIPALMSFTGWEILFQESFFLPEGGEASLPLKSSSGTARSAPPLSLLSIGQDGSASMIGGIQISDNFQTYASARAQRMELNPRVELSLPKGKPAGAAKGQPQIRLRELAEFLLDLPAEPSQDHFLPAMRLLALVLGPKDTPRPFSEATGPAQIYSSPETLPESVRILGDSYFRTMKDGVYDKGVRLVAGRLVLPAGEKTVASPLRLEKDGYFCGPLGPGRGALFYIRGHWPLLVPYPKEEGAIAWWGTLRPTPVSAEDAATIKGRLHPTRTPPNPHAKPSLNICLATPPYTMSSGSPAGTSPDWQNQVATVVFPATDAFEVKGLAPMPYQLSIRLAGFFPWKGSVFPRRGQVMDLGSVPLKEAPLLNLRHVERIVSPDGTIRSPGAVKAEAVICDGETRLRSRQNDKTGKPLMEITFAPEEDAIRLESPMDFRLRDLGFMVVVGPASFERVPSDPAGAQSSAVTEASKLKKGFTYLLEGKAEEGNFQWLFSVEP